MTPKFLQQERGKSNHCRDFYIVEHVMRGDLIVEAMVVIRNEEEENELIRMIITQKRFKLLQQ